MKSRKAFAFVLILAASVLPLTAENADDTTKVPLLSAKRISVGGYGEATYQYNLFSDSPFRHTQVNSHRDDDFHGRFDLPHAVFMLGYDFGNGWTFSSEIEFEHGGVEAAVEKEGEEFGEFEKEIERGGEVALEQFWLQKSFSNAFNIRAGHIIVPVGATNMHHMPNEFFGVFRPEGENTIMPCTWHETGISLWGRVSDWRYEVMAIPALNSSFFNTQGWAHDASASAYEFRVGNKIAAAARVDNFSLPGLRLSLSGYIGNSFNNDINTVAPTSKYHDIKGLTYIGSFDFDFRRSGWQARGHLDYGHINEASRISAFNMNLSHRNDSPYPHSSFASAAYSAGFEAGYDVFNFLRLFNNYNFAKNRKLYLFARYDAYDSYVPSDGVSDKSWSDRQVITAGLNFVPIPQIIVKAECGLRLLDEHYKKEPWMAIGITWAGMFN